MFAGFSAESLRARIEDGNSIYVHMLCCNITHMDGCANVDGCALHSLRYMYILQIHC